MSGSKRVDLAPLARFAQAAERRQRLVHALEVGTRALALALAAGIVVLALRKISVLSEGAARGLLVALVLGVTLAVIVAFRRRLPERAGAIALDRHHGLAGRIASALSFGEIGDADRTP